MKSWLIQTLLLLIIPNVLLASGSFSNYFEYQSSFMPKHADDITHYYTADNNLSSKDQITAFKLYNEALNEQIKANPNKAILWFSKGLNFRNRLQALDQQRTLGTRNILPIINQTIEYMQRSFNKAIQLDDVKKRKLTAKMYGTMKHNLNSNDRIKALQNELSLGGSGDNESQYWFSHWDVIGSLQDEGRFEEAEDALYTMKNELNAANIEQGAFKQVYQKAKVNLSKEHHLSAEKEKKFTAKTTQKTHNKTPSLFDNIQSKFETYWLMVLLNIFVIISLIVAFLKRERD